MKLKYTGYEQLRINGYGDINNGSIIEREDLVQSLKHRSDFTIIREKISYEGEEKPSMKKKGVKHV